LRNSGIHIVQEFVYLQLALLLEQAEMYT